MENNEPIYNTIGTGYNSTRKADPYIAGRLFELLSPEEDSLYLDIGCGTGNYTIALSERGLSFCGVDPSEMMLEEARKRSAAVKWVHGAAEEIPFDDDTFSGAVATLTLHHWKSLELGFSELSRVMKKGGRAVIFTSEPSQMKKYWLNHYFPQMMERSIGQMPSHSSVKAAAVKAGLVIDCTEKYFLRDEQEDLFLYSGKNRPKLYFDPAVRSGISSFSSLANSAEVEEGLAQLRDDIDSGRFPEIKDRYEGSFGDYVFTVLEKS